MKHIRMKQISVLLVLLGISSMSFAHPGHVGDSFFSGVLHPLMGFDHLLTLLAVGVFSSLSFKHKRWALPAIFSIAMVTGAMVAFSGFALPAIEQGIAASLMLIGLVMVLALNVPLVIASIPIILCGLFHGNAHGLEASAVSTIPLYMLGFVVVSVLVQILGMKLGQRMYGVHARIFGAVVMMSGIALGATI